MILELKTVVEDTLSLLICLTQTKGKNDKCRSLVVIGNGSPCLGNGMRKAESNRPLLSTLPSQIRLMAWKFATAFCSTAASTDPPPDPTLRNLPVTYCFGCFKDLFCTILIIKSFSTLKNFFGMSQGLCHSKEQTLPFVYKDISSVLSSHHPGI